MIPIPFKKHFIPIILSTCFFLLLVFQSCKKKHEMIAEDMFRITQNEIFKKADTEEYIPVFKRVFAKYRSKTANPLVIESFFKKNEYQPILVINHLNNSDLEALPEYLDKINEHGLDPAVYPSAEIKALVAKLKDKTAITTIDEAYETVAKLEILTAGAFVKYSNVLQYGVINPKKIYSRYFMATRRPDSLTMLATLNRADFKTFLDSIQPKNPQYLSLQKAYRDSATIEGLSKEESKRQFLISLERLRWRNKPYEPKYVIVNIPDYRLDVMEDGKSVLNMKVCVGQGRNMENQNTLEHFDDTARADKPFPRETPILNSVIHSVEVNPVWNIPRSIATKEIIVEAADDRFYLANKNIDVFKNGKRIADPETIDWTQVTPDNLEYEFKQRPGEDNSLGKIKFLFKNRSSVYLHDTPNKAAFRKTMRAVSHGCVRLGDPLGLAKNLFGEGADIDTIANDMIVNKPEPTNIGLPKKTPIYITYVTCWADENGAIQYRPDVYGLDIVLYAHLQNFLAK
jgi:murein L,D-transpeptidase YcbB/YkuD